MDTEVVVELLGELGVTPCCGGNVDDAVDLGWIDLRFVLVLQVGCKEAMHAIGLKRGVAEVRA